MGWVINTACLGFHVRQTTHFLIYSFCGGIGLDKYTSTDFVQLGRHITIKDSLKIIF